jgi:hypothetical protein
MPVYEVDDGSSWTDKRINRCKFVLNEHVLRPASPQNELQARLVTQNNRLHDLVAILRKVECENERIRQASLVIVTVDIRRK